MRKLCEEDGGRVRALGLEVGERGGGEREKRKCATEGQISKKKQKDQERLMLAMK